MLVKFLWKALPCHFFIRDSLARRLSNFFFPSTEIALKINCKMHDAVQDFIYWRSNRSSTEDYGDALSFLAAFQFHILPPTIFWRRLQLFLSISCVVEERKKATLDEFPAPFVSLAKQQAAGGGTKKSFCFLFLFPCLRLGEEIQLICNATF